jgi:hypothetical protein
MADWQLEPDGLYIDPGAPDGAYLLYKSGVRFSRFLHLVDGTGTTVTIDTGTGQVSIGAAVRPEPVVTVVGGVPGLLFDNDGSVVYREVSP